MAAWWDESCCRRNSRPKFLRCEPLSCFTGERKRQMVRDTVNCRHSKEREEEKNVFTFTCCTWECEMKLVGQKKAQESVLSFLTEELSYQEKEKINWFVETVHGVISEMKRNEWSVWEGDESKKKEKARSQGCSCCWEDAGQSPRCCCCCFYWCISLATSHLLTPVMYQILGVTEFRLLISQAESNLSSPVWW